MLALFVPSAMGSSRALKPLSCRNLHPNPRICRLWAGDGAHSPEELSPPAAAPKELTRISGAAQNVPGSQGHSLHPPPDCSALGMPQGTQAPALTDVSSHSSRGCRREREALGASPSSPNCSWPCPLLCQAPLPQSPTPTLPLGTLAPSRAGSSPLYTDPQGTESGVTLPTRGHGSSTRGMAPVLDGWRCPHSPISIA